MNKFQIKKIAAYIVLLIICLWAIFNFFWTLSLLRWLPFLGLIFAVYSVINIVLELTNPFFVSTGGLTISKFLNKEKIKTFSKQSKVANRQVMIVLILVITSIAIIIILFSNFIKKYEYNQLSQFGEVQKVVITKIKRLGRSQYSVFFFSIKDERKEWRLYRKNGQQIGDTCYIIFSTDNTDIVKWAEDFYSK